MVKDECPDCNSDNVKNLHGDLWVCYDCDYAFLTAEQKTRRYPKFENLVMTEDYNPSKDPAVQRLNRKLDRIK